MNNEFKIKVVKVLGDLLFCSPYSKGACFKRLPADIFVRKMKGKRGVVRVIRDEELVYEFCVGWFDNFGRHGVSHEKFYGQDLCKVHTLSYGHKDSSSPFLYAEYFEDGDIVKIEIETAENLFLEVQSEIKFCFINKDDKKRR